MHVPRQRIGLTLASLAMLLLATSFVVAAAPLADPPLPQPLAPTGKCPDDNVFYGAVPPGGEHSRVLVFVHGLGGMASDWWTNGAGAGVNDMYFLAYGAGYRTAFVNLSINPATPDNCTASSWPGNSWQDNAPILSEQIDAITQHYGVGKVDIVAHSKGGLDAQAAIILAGAWSKVHDFFALSSPFQGSIVADWACGPDAPDWIKTFRTPAACSLQTPIVQSFRTTADASPLDDAIQYYTAAGDACRPNTDPPCSAGLGPWMLTQPNGGDNDTAVTVASTYLRGATQLFVQPWTHAEMSLGKNSFPYIYQVLLSEDSPRRKAYLPFVISGPAPAARSIQTAKR